MSGAPKMTVRQIASAAGCNHKTVRAVIDRLYPGRAKNGVRQEFSEVEAFAIAAELPKRAFVGGPSQNREGSLPKTGKLPAGIQLRELRFMVKDKILSPLQVQQVLGVAPAAPGATPPARLEAPASEAEAREGFAGLEAIAGGLPVAVINKAARASAAAGAAAVRRELTRFSADSMQGRLGI